MGFVEHVMGKLDSERASRRQNDASLFQSILSATTII